MVNKTFNPKQKEQDLYVLSRISNLYRNLKEVNEMYKNLTTEEISFIAEFYPNTKVKDIVINLKTLQTETSEERAFITTLVDKLSWVKDDELATVLNDNPLNINIIDEE